MKRTYPLIVFAAVAALGLQAPAAAVTDPGRADQWGLKRVGAATAWATARGKGIVIAIVDSGIDLDHPDLRGKIVKGHDFVEDDGRPQDEEGHGTHVAGIAAAATGNGQGVSGMAPAAKIMPVRVLDEENKGSASNVVLAVRWAVDHGADVINLSVGDLGQPLFGPAFGEALDYAWNAGAIPVVAAGNEYVTSSGYADEPAIVVSATDRQDGKPSYSSGVGAARWGMAAPGGAGSPLAPREDDILSTYVGGAYAYVAGTSMAAPHVAGAAALLRSLGLSPKQTVDRLLATAKDIGAQGHDETFGAGRLDAAAAVRGLGKPGKAGNKKASPAPAGGVQGAQAPGGASAAETPDATPGKENAPSSEPASPPPGQPPTGEPVGGDDAGRDLPEGDGGLSIAVWVAGLVTVMLAILIGWTLFRPNPPE